MNWQCVVSLLAPLVGEAPAQQIATYALPRLPSALQQSIWQGARERLELYALTVNAMRALGGMSGLCYSL